MPRDPLWRCPTCAQTFVSKNLPHSCSVIELDDHFVEVEPIVRDTFDALLAAVEASGPVTVNATKSRISFQVRMRFGGVEKPRRDHLLANFVLTRAVASDRLRRVEHVPPFYYVHRLRLSRPEEVDAEVSGWFAEAYEIGEQRHVTDKKWVRERHPPPWVHLPG